MKRTATPRGVPACAPALELYPAAIVPAPRSGQARSGGRGPRQPTGAVRRASAPVNSMKPGNWSRQVRHARSRRDSQLDGTTVCI